MRCYRLTWIYIHSRKEQVFWGSTQNRTEISMYRNKTYLVRCFNQMLCEENVTSVCETVSGWNVGRDKFCFCTYLFLCCFGLILYEPVLCIYLCQPIASHLVCTLYICTARFNYLFNLYCLWFLLYVRKSGYPVHTCVSRLKVNLLLTNGWLSHNILCGCEGASVGIYRCIVN